MVFRGGRRRPALDAERRAAAARGLGVRVVEDESLADEARVVVERRAVQKPVAARVDIHLGAVGSLEDVVAVARSGFPGERIAESGTSARLDADTESTLGDAVLQRHPPD